MGIDNEKNFDHPESSDFQARKPNKPNSEEEFEDEDFEEGFLEEPLEIPDPAWGATLRLGLLFGILIVLLVGGFSAIRKGWVQRLLARPKFSQARNLVLKGEPQKAFELLSVTWKAGLRDEDRAREVVDWVITNQFQNLSQDTKEAIQNYSKVLLVSASSDNFLLARLAKALYRVGDYQDVIQILRNRDREEWNEDLYSVYAKTLFQIGYFRSCLRIASESQNVLQSDPELELFLKIARWATGEEPEQNIKKIFQSIDPTNPPTSILRGLLRGAARTGDRLMAATALKELIQRSAVQYTDLAEYSMGLLLTGRKKEAEEVLIHWPGTLQTIEDRAAQARILIAAQNYSSATLMLKRWVSNDNEPDLSLCILYALALTKNKATEDSILFAKFLLRKSTTLSALGALSYLLQADSTATAGEVGWDEELFQNLITELQDKPAAIVDLAEFLEEKQLYSQAFQLLRRQLETAENDARYYPTLYRLARRVRDEHYLFLAARKAYEQNPWRQDFAQNYAEVLLMSRSDTPEVLKITQRLYQLSPNIPGYAALYAWALAKNGQTDSAAKVIAQIRGIPLTPKEKLWFQLANVELYWKTGDHAQAKNFLTDGLLSNQEILSPQRQWLQSLVTRLQ